MESASTRLREVGSVQRPIYPAVLSRIDRNSLGGGGVSVEDDGFIQRIRESPHDEARRLIYADWLEERGDARGEFLRTESRLRRATTLEPDYPAALARWRDLRDRVPTDWLDGLGWRVNGLLLPRALVDLLASGRWGKSSEIHVTEGTWGVPDPAVYAFDCREMGRETATVCGLGWWGKPDSEHPPGDIDAKLTVMIADLGMGSDAPFALDYRATFEEPRVLLYRWRVAHESTVLRTDVGSNRWVEIAPQFGDFWRQITGNPA